MKNSLISRIKRCERKLNPQPQSFLLADWGDGRADKKKKQILKNDPDAEVIILRVKWVN